MEDKDGRKMVNPNYRDPYKHPITEIISKWGDYTLCNKQEGSYTFPYLTHVSGISRDTLSLCSQMKKELSPEAEKSSNLFGFSLNVYEPQGTLLIEPGTDTDNSGSIIEGIYMYVLYTIPAAILLFVILWGMMIVRIANKLSTSHFAQEHFLLYMFFPFF